MRATWTGPVTFGLVSFGVRLFAAVEDHDVTCHKVHAPDGGRVAQQWVCKTCGETVPHTDLARGAEVNGTVVALTDEDMGTLPAVPEKTAELVRFVPTEQVNPLALGTGYHMEPEPAGRRPYELLRGALETTGQAGMVRITMRGRTSLAVLRPVGAALVLQLMAWPDEIRTPVFDVLSQGVKVSEAERRIALGLVEAMSGDLTADDPVFQDEHQVALAALVAAKAVGEPVDAPAALVEGTGPVGLLEMLAASVEAAKATSVPKPRTARSSTTVR